MKTYFAKYLPVEGKIKEENFFFNGDMLCKCDSSHASKEWKTDEFVNGYSLLTKIYYSFDINKCKKAKLFLCSRDIHVDNEYFVNGSNKKHTCKLIDWEQDGVIQQVEDYTQYPQGSYKVIGEISSDAIWVKEGDEFDKDQLAIALEEGHHTPLKEHSIVDKNTIIKIECPTCKKFH